MTRTQSPGEAGRDALNSGGTTSVEWVFFDAFGTLVFLDGFFPRLKARLAALGHAVALPDVEYAARKEFAYYKRHSLAARDAASLAQLRRECGGVLLEGLRERNVPLPLTDAAMADALVDSLAFAVYPDVLPTITALAGEGVRLGVISNWDCSLPEVLRRLGLAEFLEVIAVSALCGSEKPDGGIFAEALRLANVAPGAALHVGDSYENDLLGARAAGMRAVLLDRDGSQAPPGAPAIRDLRALAPAPRVGPS